MATRGLNYRLLIEGLKKLVRPEDFSVQYMRNEVKIFSNNMEVHDKIRTGLQTAQTPFYTYTKKENKVKKMVFKGPPNLEIHHIMRELKEAQLEPQEVIKMKASNDKESYSYLVTVPNHIQLKQIRQTRNIDQAIIRWESYAKKKSYTQCHRCQNFGHGSSNCWLTPRCVKCAEEHQTKDCTLVRTQTSKTKCCNCLGEHTANYSQCPALLTYLEKTQQGRKQQQQQPAKEARTFARKVANPQVSYSQATNNSQQNRQQQQSPKGDFEELADVIRKLDEKHNIRNLIEKVKQLTAKLDQCRSENEKVMLLFQFLNP